METATLSRLVLATPEQLGANKQAPPVEGRFLLRVDGQLKRPFSDNEPAMTAGSAIKKRFPIVMVTVEDTKDGGIDVVKA
jgi:hypothetical protein